MSVSAPLLLLPGWSAAAAVPARRSPPTEFTIQPHPATTNDPADLQRGFGGDASAFNATGPHVPSAQIASSLEKPKTREEVSPHLTNRIHPPPQ